MINTRNTYLNFCIRTQFKVCYRPTGCHPPRSNSSLTHQLLLIWGIKGKLADQKPNPVWQFLSDFLILHLGYWFLWIFVCVFTKKPQANDETPKSNCCVRVTEAPWGLAVLHGRPPCWGCSIARDLRILELLLRASPCVLGTAVRNQGSHLEK